MNIQAAAAQLHRFAQFLSAAKEIGEVLKVAADAEAGVEGLMRTKETLELEVASAHFALKELQDQHATQLRAAEGKIERNIAGHKEEAKGQIKKIKDSVTGVAERAAKLRLEAEDARKDKDAALTYRQAEIEQSDCLLAELQTAAAELQERIAGLSG